MMPRAPAFETAEASWERAIQPIGACTIGISMPSIRVTRFSNFICSSRKSNAEGSDFGRAPARVTIRFEVAGPARSVSRQRAWAERVVYSGLDGRVSGSRLHP